MEIVKQKTKMKLIVFINLCALLIAGAYILCGLNEYKITVFFSVILFSTICSAVLYIDGLKIFEPFFMFSALYLAVPITTWYMVATNFSTDLHAMAVEYDQNFFKLLESSTLLFLVGYVLFAVAYIIFREKMVQEKFYIKYNNKFEISDDVIKFVVVFFAALGVGNFLYNVHLFANNNIIRYLQNIGARASEFQTGGTTLGYNFIYFSLFVSLFAMFRDNKKINIKFILLFLTAVVIKVSTGRIFSTLILIAMILGMFYLHELSKSGSVKTIKYILGVFLLGIFAILFYLYRAYSGLKVNDIYDSNMMLDIVLSVFDRILGRGNTPNIALVPKIIDSWKSDIGFLYGKSIVIGITGFLPNSMRDLTSLTSVLIKNTWFSSVQGGNLPPTCVGELYANFGVVGIMLGMPVVGVLFALLGKCSMQPSNYWLLVIYMDILVEFVFIYPKNEWGNFPMWNITFYTLCYLMMRVMTMFINYFKGVKY